MKRLSLRAGLFVATLCTTVGLAFGTASPAYADNCAQLLKEKGQGSILTDPQVLEDCLRTGRGWAVTTGGVVTLGGVIIGTIGFRRVKPKSPTDSEAPSEPPKAEPLETPEPPETQEEKDKAHDCARLQADFEARKAKKDKVVSDLQKSIGVLESMYSSQRKHAESLGDLTRLRDEALVYLAGAGAAMGVAAGAAAAAWAAATAAELATTAEGVAAAGQAAELAAAGSGSGGFSAAAAATKLMLQSKSLEAAAALMAAGGGVGGGGAGAVAGKVVQDLMADSMGNFAHAGEVLDRMTSEMEQTFREKQQELRFAVRDLGDLKNKLQAECQISVDVGTDAVELPSRGGGIRG